VKYDYQIDEIQKKDAHQFVSRFHYSPVMPKITKHYLGFYLNDKLKGVLTLGWGVQPKQTINKMFPSLVSKDYYEIGKMCMDEEMPRNSESQMISSTIKWMKKNTKCLFLYTLADGIMGKCGYVYQASNFYYGGKYFTPTYLMDNGEKLHQRSTRQLVLENARFSNKRKITWMTTDFMKSKGIKKIKGYMFRYIYPLSKTAKRIMETQSTMEWNRDYPKDNDLKWKDITNRKNTFSIPKPDFTFTDMKYNHKNHIIEKSNQTFSTERKPNLLSFFR
jgi:hypothetical protein